MATNPELLEGLKTFLRIPSVSTLPEHKPDIRRAAQFCLDALRGAGMKSTELIEAEDEIRWCTASGWTRPGSRRCCSTVTTTCSLPDPLDEWISPPFEPTVRGDNLFARGASDDKGQTYILIKAVESLMQASGKLPVNVRFLIEGEEETGGEHISAYVSGKPARLAADAAVICDTEMFAPELPTLCVGLRGIVYGELHVEGANHDLHSGVYGGAAPNPLQAVAEIICALKGRDGRIRIPGFYDRVEAPSPKEREAWALLPFDEAAYTRQEMGAKELVGEPGVPLFERLWARPTLEVHGIRGGFIGEGGKTVIPARAVAKISARLVANQNPEEAAAQIQAAVRSACPKGVTAEFRVLSSAAPSLVNPDNRYIQAAAVAMKQVFGADTVYMRSGGSIPIVGLFDQYLKIPSVMMGFGLPDDNIHAPNEKMYLPNVFRGVDAVKRYLEVLGA
jgi:acetylornithine deacetylase/succinyl-diaminopimelate desuccinylase-like protein